MLSCLRIDAIHSNSISEKLKSEAASHVYKPSHLKPLVWQLLNTSRQVILTATPRAAAGPGKGPAYTGINDRSSSYVYK